MKSTLRIIMLLPFAMSMACAAWSPLKDLSSATLPEDRDYGSWRERHESFNALAAQGEIDLIFLGDSITQGWESGGAEVWQKYYGDRNALNLGIGGDRTQHVLWRIDNGNLDGIDPKLAVIMIGTNNSRDNTAEAIAAGIEAIVLRLRELRPAMKILLLGVFPRSEKPDELRAKLIEVNRIVSDLHDGSTVYYLDIGDSFLNDDDSISRDIMPDHLHLSQRGYDIWAESIEGQVKQLLGE